MITKLDMKNKLKNIFVFYQVEEREKRRKTSIKATLLLTFAHPP